MGKNFFSIIIVVLFGIIAGLPLLHEGLIPTHDGEYHIIRFFLFNEAFNDGNLYPRWTNILNNGFGVPLFTFVYPFPNYIAVFLHSLGVSFIDSFGFEMFAAILIGAIFFYLWTKEFWGRLGGIVSSVFYTFSPYHFVDIYIRGSVGEVWALAFFPAFLWAYTRFAESKRGIFMVFSSICLALIIFSHNILALMFFFFCLSYAALLIYRNKNKRYLIHNTFYLILLGLGLSAIFWMPAIYETKYVTGLQIFDVASHFPDLYQLIIPSWGSGFSGTSFQNELSFQIGIANLISVFLSLVIVFFLLKTKFKKTLFVIFFLTWFFLILFLMLDISKPIWVVILFMNYFQFPWRLLSLEILLASFLAGSVFPLAAKHIKFRIFLALFLLFLPFIFGIGYIKPAYYHYRTDDYYIKRSNFIDGTNSPGNVFNTIWLKSIPPKEKEIITFLKGEGKIAIEKTQSNKHVFSVNSFKSSEVLMNLAYYPGWEVYVNSVRGKIKQTENGRISFLLPPGQNTVEVVFKDTFIRKFSGFVSLVSILFITVLLKRGGFATINK